MPTETHKELLLRLAANHLRKAVEKEAQEYVAQIVKKDLDASQREYETAGHFNNLRQATSWEKMGARSWVAERHKHLIPSYAFDEWAQGKETLYERRLMVAGADEEPTRRKRWEAEAASLLEAELDENENGKRVVNALAVEEWDQHPAASRWRAHMTDRTRAWMTASSFQAATRFVESVYDNDKFESQFRSGLLITHDSSLNKWNIDELSWDYGDDDTHLDDVIAGTLLAEPDYETADTDRQPQVMPPRSATTAAASAGSLCGQQTQAGKPCAKPIAAGKAACHLHG